MKRWKLKPYLIVILMLFMSLLLVLIMMTIYIGISHFFTQQISETRLEMLYTQHSRLTERLNHMEETALSISTDRILRQALDQGTSAQVYETVVMKRNLNRWLDGFTAIKPYINSIQIFTDRFLPKPVIGGRNSVILGTGEVYWSSTALDSRHAAWLAAREDPYSAYERQPVMTYVLTIFDHKGNEAGYVSVNLSLASLSRILFTGFDESGGERRRLLLLDENGRLAADLANDGGSDNLSAHAARERIGRLGNRAGHSSIRIDGTDYLMIYTSQEQAEWRLIELIESREVYRDIHRIRNMLFMISVFMLVITVPIAAYLSKLTIGPIPSLLRAIQKVESGNFNIHLEKHPIVEFDKLSQSFVHMSGQLRSLLEQLEVEHRKKRDLELKVLQSQINPHFLYNTLDMINWMAAMKGNHEVSLMAANLARLFRISVSKGSTFIPLREELEHARAYADLQRSRYQLEFIYREEIDGYLKAAYVPKIIIQPVIENAFIHGFRDGTVPAEITVRAEKTGESTFRLLIEDNGCGLSGGDPLGSSDGGKSNRGKGGYGLRNVQERIQLYMGPAYGVQLDNRREGGAIVAITLPILTSLDHLDPFHPGKAERRA